ncbi:MAG: hypothetical protein PHR71_00310 [Polaromonas sp.]|nr:hypothetical protein [Polaromonas sp.]
MMRLVVTVAALLALAACGEKPQTGYGIKSDVPAFQGAQDPFVVSGWKPGDKDSWEQQLKTRTQHTQNDYVMMK